MSPRDCQGRFTEHKFPWLRDLAAYLREVCHHYWPSPIRGRRECRMPDAPAASCALWVVSMHTSIHSESPESSGIPRAMVYGLYRALVSAKSARMCERAVLTNRPSLDLSPWCSKAAGA